MAAVMVFAVPAAQAATDALMSVGANGAQQDYHSTSTTAHTLIDQGATATLQFRATPGCSGAACSIDGPAVGAFINGAYPDQRAESTLRYSFSVIGGPALVPIYLTGQYATSSPDAPRGGTLAVDVLRVQSGTGASLFNFRSICYSYPPELNEQGPEENCGAGSFSDGFFAAAGSSVNVYMNALALQAIAGRTPAAASAYIDPYFAIDPSWLATHEGYSLVFDDGVGNGMPGAFGTTTPVPEPETFALFGAGLLALACRRRRRGR